MTMLQVALNDYFFNSVTMSPQQEQEEKNNY